VPRKEQRSGVVVVDVVDVYFENRQLLRDAASSFTCHHNKVALQ